MHASVTMSFSLNITRALYKLFIQLILVRRTSKLDAIVSFLSCNVYFVLTKQIECCIVALKHKSNTGSLLSYLSLFVLGHCIDKACNSSCRGSALVHTCDCKCEY